MNIIRIGFRDTTTLIQDNEGLKATIDGLDHQWDPSTYDQIVAIDARGFIFGSALAYKRNVGIVLARKKGKLPAQATSQTYNLEYGTGEIEIHNDSIVKNSRYLVIDDLIATGGTAKAACEIIEQLGGIVVGCGFIVELPFLEGRQFLSKYKVKSLVSF